MKRTSSPNPHAPKAPITRLLLIFISLSIAIYMLILPIVIFPSMKHNLQDTEERFVNSYITSTNHNLVQFIDNRVTILEKMSQEPAILQAVMHNRIKSSALFAFLSNNPLLEKETDYIIYDVEGNQIYRSSTDIEYPRPIQTLETILSGSHPYGVVLKKIGHQRFFMRLLVPVIYQGHIEGVFEAAMLLNLLDVFGHNLLTYGDQCHLSIFQNETLISHSYIKAFEQDLSYSSVVDTPNAPIRLVYDFNQQQFIEKHQQIIWSIALQLFFTSILAFALLLLLGKRLLGQPYEKLRQSEERYNLAVSGSAEGLWDWDITTNQIYYSPRFKSMLGYKNDEFPNEFDSFSNALHPQDRERTIHALHQHLKGKQIYNVVYRLKQKSGQYRWFRARGQALWDQQGIALRMAGGQSDIHDLMLAKEEAQHEKRRAEAASAAKSEFLATMSHEIRTPLNGILGLSQVLLDSNLPEESREHLQSLNHAGEALLTIVSDILDFSKIESGHFTLESYEFNLEQLCCQALQLHAILSKHKGIPVILDYDLNCPKQFLGDGQRLKQVLINLINNALKFTQKGHVYIQVKAIESHGIEIHVMDTGIGIPEKYRSALFKPFKQMDGSNTRKYGGTGLGLTISRRLIEMMAGEIGFSSEHHHGSDFWLKIPLEATCEKLQLTPEFNNQIFLVDNHPLRATTLAKQLTSTGANVRIISHVNTADEIYRAIHNVSGHYLLILNQVLGEHLHKSGENYAKMLLDKLQVPTLLIDDCPVSIQTKHPNFLCVHGPIPMQNLINKIKQLEARQEGYDIAVYAQIEDEQLNSPIQFAKILMVDDTPLNQIIVTAMLKRHQALMDSAQSGQEAIQKVQEKNYDLILMDCLMPEMNGYETTQAIRKIEGKKEIPIIAMTANASSEVRDLCFASGMVDFIAKPFKKELLIDTLTHWLLKRRKANHCLPTHES